MNARLLRLAGAALVGLAAQACNYTHPLDVDGAVTFRSSIVGPLFAAPPAPITTRQRYAATYTLLLTEQGKAAHGAFVDLSINPAASLSFVEVEEGCRKVGEGMRCTANEDGIARFRVEVKAEWVGTATITASWSGKTADEKIEVKPAGIPAGAYAFQIVMGEITSTNTVVPTYHALTCTDNPPVGEVDPWPNVPRSVPFRVRASVDVSQPGLVENAPVIIEATGFEVGLSTLSSCANRTSRQLATLDSKGETDTLYACFSDLGSTALVRAVSGEQQFSTPTLTVLPEPYYLRVFSTGTTVRVGRQSDLVQVSAYDLNVQRIAMFVSVSTKGVDVTLPGNPMQLADEASPMTTIAGTPNDVGTLTLEVRPASFLSPVCTSAPITVTSTAQVFP